MKKAQAKICFAIIFLTVFNLLRSTEKEFLYTVAEAPVMKLSSATAYTVGAIGGGALYQICENHIKTDDSTKEGGPLELGIGVSGMSLGLQYLLKKYTDTDNSYLAHAIFPVLVTLEKTIKESLPQAALYTSSSVLIPLCGFLSACAWHAYQTVTKGKKEQEHVQ